MKTYCIGLKKKKCISVKAIKKQKLAFNCLSRPAVIHCRVNAAGTACQTTQGRPRRLWLWMTSIVGPGSTLKKTLNVSGGGRGQGRGGRATLAVVCRERHLRGENLEFWRLHCNVFA